MAPKIPIVRLDGSRVAAVLVKHLRTLTGATNSDVELYRLADGTEVECISPSNDGRVDPREVDPTLDHYPGYRPGE
jgi:hypothetical protein